MTLIFVNRFFYPDHSATSQMLSDLAFDLAAAGERVIVIASRQVYDASGVVLPAREDIAGVEIHRAWTTHFGRARLAGRALDDLCFYVSAAWHILKVTQRGDVVIAKTDPPMLSVVAAPIARLKGAKCVNWLQDVFPEVAEALGVGGRGIARLALGALRIVRNFSLRRADMNVVLGERMAEHIAALGIGAEKIRLISNWADGTLLKPVAPGENALRGSWGLSGKCVVGYSGNLGRAHDYTTLLDAIAAIELQTKTSILQSADEGEAKSDAGLQIAWLFIGGGALHGTLQKEVARRGLTSVRFEPYQPRDTLAQSLSAADVHVVSLRRDLEGLIVPSKFYGVAAVARPTIFIGDQDGEIARILKRHDCGVTVAQGNSASLARTILELARNPANCRRMGLNARRAFDAEFDRPKAVAHWQDVLREIDGRTGV